MTLPTGLESALRGVPGVAYVGDGPHGIEILIEADRTVPDVTDRCTAIIRRHIADGPGTVDPPWVTKRLSVPTEPPDGGAGEEPRLLAVVLRFPEAGWDRGG